jgi:hypothetical protein
MGERYSSKLDEKIRSLAGRDVRVYINGSLSPHYRRHVEETVTRAGARLVDKEEEANFVFVDGSDPPEVHGHITAVVTDGELLFRGHL